LETEELKQAAFRRLFLTDPEDAAPSRIDPAHLAAYLTTTDREVAFVIPVTDPGHDRCRVIASVYQKAENGPDQRVPFYAGGIPSTGTAGLHSEVQTAKYQAPRYGTYRFHLATAEQKPNSEELQEDQGVDLEVKIVKQEMGEGMGGQDSEAMQDLIASLQGMLNNPNLPAALRAQLEQQIAALQAQANGAQANQGEAGVFPPAMVASLRTMAEKVSAGPTEEDPAEMLAGMERTLRDSKPAIGLVQGAAGPVGGAMITLVEQPIYQQLRQSTGVPQVKWWDWFPQGVLEGATARYNFGRTNGNGEYVLMGLADGTYGLLASAPGYALMQQEVTVTRGEAYIVDLPEVTLGQEGGGTGEAGGFQEATWAPDVLVAVSPQQVNADVLGRDGTFRAQVSLRPLAGFSGPVTLSVPDMPAGVEARFEENPVPLDAPKTVSMLITTEREAPAPTVINVKAECGDLVRHAPVHICLGTGQLVAKPEALQINPGDRTELRIGWDAVGEGGQAAFISVGKLPPGVWVKAKAIRAHEHAEPLVFDGLTVEKAEELREGLRPIAEVPRVERPGRLIVTPALITRAPAEAPFKGILLAPGGWADLTIAISKDAEPGTYRIPVKCEIGAQVEEREIRVVVEK